MQVKFSEMLAGWAWHNAKCSAAKFWIGQTYRLLLDPSLAAAVGNIGTNLQIYANSGTLVLNTGTGVLSVTLPDSTAFINVGTVVNTATDAFRFRSNYSTIRVDSNILNVSRPNDIHRYISNTTNMRENLSAVGETENEFFFMSCLSFLSSRSSSK